MQDHIQYRDSLKEHTPIVFQPFLTWLTGIPYTGQKPLWRLSNKQVLLAYTISLMATVSIALHSFDSNNINLLTVIIFGIIIASLVRRMDVIIIHHCLHFNVMKSRRSNIILHNILSFLMFRRSFIKEYRLHVLHHRDPCNPSDFDVDYLEDIGHSASYSDGTNMRIFLFNLINPLFYLNRLKDRLLILFDTDDAIGYRLGLALYLFVLTFLSTFGTYSFQVLFFLVLPITIFFDLIAYLYTVGEHRWWCHKDPQDSNRRWHGLSHARFIGDRLPTEARGAMRFRQWSVWWGRVVCFHLPYRLLILFGDTMHHDLHHLAPRSDWANPAYERRSWEDRGYEFDVSLGSYMDHIKVGFSSPDSLAGVPSYSR